MRNKPAFCLAAGWLAATLLGHTAAAENLPSDERIKTGTLSNGVKWMYRQHNQPPGRMAILIHVDTGSLNETDAQRGLAHFLEHMAFNGTVHFKPGELIPYFESIGMQFGDNINAFTSFDQTVYFLVLPDTKTETVDRALTVLSDFAYRQLLPPEEIDKERGVVLAELRAGLSPEQRIRDQLFPQLFAGSRFGNRLPIGRAEVIEKAPPPELESYYRTWYRPEHVALILVGDAPPDAYLPLIEKQFGVYKPKGQAQPVQGPEFKPFTQERAIIVTDPDYATGDVDIFALHPGRPPTTTVAQARVELLERLGTWIIERRFDERIKQSQATYRSANTAVRRFCRDGLLANASAVGDPQDWEKMLEQVLVEINRARAHGFTARELKLAVKELLASAERDARTESTRDAQEILREIGAAVNDREPVLSAQQELELLSKLLPTIKPDEVSAAFAENFKPGAFAYVLTMPQKDDVKLPSTDEVLAAARAALARQTEPPKEEQRPTTLLEKEPTPAKVVESETDPDLGITSAWLDNGVRVHHRFMDYKQDTVLVSITLAGGEIEETAENAGVTTVAVLAFSQPATRRLRSTDIEDIMTGKNIALAVNLGGDTVTLTVSGSPRDLETGLQLAHALLTDGQIEQNAFQNWQLTALRQYEEARKQPDFAAYEALHGLVSGGDPRRTMMTTRKIQAQSLARSQAWLERLCRQAPIEVAAVGDLKLEQALPLIANYVGSLPKRERTAAHLDKLRKFNRPPGPLERRISLETITPQAVTICGFLGCKANDPADVRALDLAAHTLDSRLLKRIREEKSLVYSTGAESVPAETYDDAGIFGSGAPCAPDKADEVVQEIEAIFKAFAESGPTTEELENAKKQVANSLDTELKEPSFWYRHLQHLDLHKFKLADFKNLKEAYAASTAEQVRDVFRKYDVPARVFRIVVVPTAPTSKSETAPEKKPPAPVAKP